MSTSGQVAELGTRSPLYQRVRPALVLLRLMGLYPNIKTGTSDSNGVLKFNKKSLAYSVTFISLICSIYVWRTGTLWVQFWHHIHTIMVFTRFFKTLTSSAALIGYSVAFFLTIMRSKVILRLFLKWENIHYNIKLQNQDLPKKLYIILRLVTFAIFVAAEYGIAYKEKKYATVITYVNPIFFCNATVCVVIPILKEFQAAFKALSRILHGQEPARPVNYNTMIFVADWWLQLKDLLQDVGHWLSPLYIVSGVHMLTIISWWIAMELSHELDFRLVFLRHLLRYLFWIINFVLFVIDAAEINDMV